MEYFIKTDIISGILTSIFVTIILASVTWLWKKLIGKVKINRIDIRNAPKTFQGNIIYNSNKPEILKNYIENEIIVENSKDSILIKDLIIGDVKVKKYFCEDIIVQRGFDMEKQQVNFIIFNNGNKTSRSNIIIANIYYINKVVDKTMLLETVPLPQLILKKGDIKKIFSKELDNQNLLRHFSNSLPDYKQSIKLELSVAEGNQILSQIEIPYSTSVKKFVMNLGGGGPVDRTLTPIVELEEPYKQLKYQFRVNQSLYKGVNQIRFNILVDAPCQVQYSVKLLDNNSKVVSKYIKQNITIHFPNYHLISPYDDDMFTYLLNHNINESNYDDVKLKEPRLINTPSKVKKEYNIL
ncbi:hypothetical protein ABID29_001911 [Streptococcus rupicaprae]|uniref:Uncharacterized protein n=1 Tax=Streptococcus rupicaprae TaxID=759619 RepID=A0ABV2FJT8_9STRE